jgi:hypothetical protein
MEFLVVLVASLCEMRHLWISRSLLSSEFSSLADNLKDMVNQYECLVFLDSEFEAQSTHLHPGNCEEHYIEVHYVKFII